MSAPDNTFLLATKLEKLVKDAPQEMLVGTPEAIAAKLSKTVKATVSTDQLYAALDLLKKKGKLAFVKGKHDRLTIWKPRPLSEQHGARDLSEAGIARNSLYASDEQTLQQLADTYGLPAPEPKPGEPVPETEFQHGEEVGAREHAFMQIAIAMVGMLHADDGDDDE